MRVVSLVPSWTESLIAWGVPVVGRTRFCIHPQSRVFQIPAVGGTKNPDWEKVRALNPDLVIVDKEENTKEILQELSCDIHVSHVQSVWDMPIELERLAQSFLSHEELSVAAQVLESRDRWETVLNRAPDLNVESLPGVTSWLREPEERVRRILYVIWKDPWMVVSKETFIGSMFGYFGFQKQFPSFSTSYPQVDLGDYEEGSTLFLFSSEPYPFAKNSDALMKFPNPMALVDGESYSWFGKRSLAFLESLSR